MLLSHVGGRARVVHPTTHMLQTCVCNDGWKVHNLFFGWCGGSSPKPRHAVCGGRAGAPSAQRGSSSEASFFARVFCSVVPQLLSLGHVGHGCSLSQNGGGGGCVREVRFFESVSTLAWACAQMRDLAMSRAPQRADTAHRGALPHDGCICPARSTRQHAYLGLSRTRPNHRVYVSQTRRMMTHTRSPLLIARPSSLRSTSLTAECAVQPSTNTSHHIRSSRFMRAVAWRVPLASPHRNATRSRVVSQLVAGEVRDESSLGLGHAALVTLAISLTPLTLVSPIVTALPPRRTRCRCCERGVGCVHVRGERLCLRSPTIASQRCLLHTRFPSQHVLSVAVQREQQGHNKRCIGHPPLTCRHFSHVHFTHAMTPVTRGWRHFQPAGSSGLIRKVECTTLTTTRAQRHGVDPPARPNGSSRRTM
jgi:hypothetical protein